MQHGLDARTRKAERALRGVSSVVDVSYGRRSRSACLTHVPHHLYSRHRGNGTADGEGSGLLNTAIVGGAVIPLAQGFIADRIGIHHAFILPVICYLYILFFAAKGQPKKRS